MERLSGVPLDGWLSRPCKHYIRMEKVAWHKRSSLLGPFVSYKENMFCENGPCFLSVKTLFLVNFNFEE